MIVTRRRLPRLAAVATTVVLGFVSVAAAKADTVVPLPDNQVVRTLGDGTVATLSLTEESAIINPSLGDTPVHRNAWVTGKATLNLSAPTDGRVYAGYIVGCQVDIGGGGPTGAFGSSSDFAGTMPEINANGVGGNLTLGPGQAQSFYILDIEHPDDYGNERHYNYTEFHKSDNPSLTWTDSTIGLTGCAGYAQARSFAQVEIYNETDAAYITVYGQPFSIG